MSTRLLAYLTYSEYLLTPYWKQLREEAIKRAGGRCALCSYQGDHLQVHHRTYERLGEELPEDLTALCPDCHGAFELGLKVQGG